MWQINDHSVKHYMHNKTLNTCKYILYNYARVLQETRKKFWSQNLAKNEWGLIPFKGIFPVKTGSWIQKGPEGDAVLHVKLLTNSNILVSIYY